MRELKLFQWFINIALVVFALAVVKYLYEYPLGILMEKGSIYGMDLSNEENTVLVKVFAFIKMAIVLIFAQAIYFLKLTIKYFLNKNYFENRITRYFRWAGYMLLITGVLSFIIQLIVERFHEVLMLDFRYGMILSEDHFFNRIFAIFMGLFFVIISSAFFQASELKQENDLTI